MLDDCNWLPLSAGSQGTVCKGELNGEIVVKKKFISDGFSSLKDLHALQREAWSML